jgi:hypothetical protein
MSSGSSKHLLTSRLSYIKLPIIYTVLTLPFVLIKNGLQLIYDFLLQLAREEIFEGKRHDDGFSGVIFLGVFCIIALVTHYIEAYNDLVFLALLLVWGIDILFSRYKYSCKQTARILKLSKQSDEFTLEILDLAGKDKDYIRIAPPSIQQVEMQYSYIYGGAFQGVIATVWQVYLVTENDRFLMFEEIEIQVAYAKAKKLVSLLDGIPYIIFASSEGCGIYAAKRLYSSESIFYKRKTQSTIRVNRTKNKLHIWSQWKFCNSWRLFLNISHQLINFIFLILLINALACFGFMLESVFIAVWNQNLTPEKLVEILYSIKSNVNLSDIFECSFVVGFLFFQGIEISQEEHFLIDQNHIDFYLNHKKMNQLNTKKFETVLFIKEVKPLLLLLASDQAIEVPGLQTKEEFMSLLFAIEEGVTEYRELNKN